MSETERLTDSVKELLGGGRDERLAGLLENAHAADISSVLRELPLPDQVRLFRLLSSQHAGEVLSELDDPTQRELLRALDEQEVSRVLDQMPADDVVEVVEELPKEEAEKILDLMAEEKSEEVQELLEYREGTAGRLMSPNVVAVHEAATVAQAIEHIRKSKSGDDAFYVYVVDDHDHLVGFVPLHRLLTADPRTPIHAIRNADVESVAVDTDQEEVARLVERYDLVQVPVVDASRRLLGAIGVDDVIDIIHEEATEDIQRLGGVAGDETVLDPPEAVFTKRLVWRLINLGTAVLAASVIGLFESSIRSRHRARRGLAARAGPRALEGTVAGPDHRRGQRPRDCSDRLPVEGPGPPLAHPRRRAALQHAGRRRRGNAGPDRAQGVPNRPGDRVQRDHHHVH